jgi:thioester reductase-like protein
VKASNDSPALEAVAAVVAEVLRVEVGQLRLDVPLQRYGLDSLAMVEVVEALEQGFCAALEMEALGESPTVADLRAALRPLPAAGPVDHDPYQAMLADAGLAAALVCAAEATPATPRRLLLTGATGFLGAFLVERLLREPDFELICLVRCAAARAGLARLMATLASYGLEPDAAAWQRVRVLPANLALPGLGLRPRDRALALEADAVFHLAAAVNWVAPYSALRAINVRATLEILQLAGEGRARPCHILSSLAAVYSTEGPRKVDEKTVALTGLRGLHFGYAQSKAVLEALARAARARGLPTYLYRAALITGSSHSGRQNPEDFFSLLWRGCVRLGAAPDLDWQLDACPVDHVVEVLARCLLTPGAEDVLHLLNPRPRAWREAVLWMNLYGHAVELLPYDQWLARLEAACAADAEQPLQSLRGFFRARAAGAYLPELYEEGRRSEAQAERSRSAIAGFGRECPPLDSTLLEKLADDLVAGSFLPKPAVGRESRLPPLDPDFAFFARFLPELERVEALERGSRHSILTELTSWAFRRRYGLFRYRLHQRGGSCRDVLLKVKPRDTETMAVACRVAALADPTLGAAYQPWVGKLGFAEGHHRELALLGRHDPRWRRHGPEIQGLVDDDVSGHFCALLEWLGDAELLDSADDPAGWAPAHLEAALDGLAALQAIHWGREAELRATPWLGPVLTTSDMAAMAPLWSALETFARPHFAAWAGPELATRHRALIDGIGAWWSQLESLPRTLIHHDFNPRNLCFRRDAQGLRLIAYDWELATWQIPQRDLAELLCFVLGPETPAEVLAGWIEYHRRALERETGQNLDPSDWRHGFSLALADLLIHRLPLYALVHRFRRQTFLPRVVATWQRLDQLSRTR